MSDWELSIHGDVEKGILLCLFAIALELCGRALQRLGGTDLLGYLFAGLVLGPQILDFVPGVESIRVIGRIGVAFLLMEAGLHLDKHVVKELGLQAFGLTICGMSAPLFGAIGVMYLLGYRDFLQAFAVGACFMPTSVGMSVQILGDFNEMDTLAGQMIVVVAMVDDILSLVVLAVIEQLGGFAGTMSSEGHDAVLAHKLNDGSASSDGEFELFAVLRPLLASTFFAIVLCAWSLAHHSFIGNLEAKMEEAEAEQQASLKDDAESKEQVDTVAEAVSPREQFAWRCHTLMLVEALVLGTMTCTYSTELLGVFFAGFSFSTSPATRQAFHHMSMPIMKWLGMAFFASLGFSLPVEVMLSWKVWAFGLVLTVPSVSGKVLTGMAFMSDKHDGLKVGWGRVGRGEFAFYLADVGHSVGIIGPEAYAMTVWALLNGSGTFPFAFRYVMNLSAQAAIDQKTTSNPMESVETDSSAAVQESDGDED